MSPIVLEALRELYARHDVAYREIEHEPTCTSEQSAAARGESLDVGGKALLMKADREFSLFVISASRRIDSSKIRSHLGTRKLRFGTSDELMELTGLVSGSVPPFGKPVLPLDLYVDESVTRNDKIAFNAGKLTVSHVLSIEDYLQLAQPTIFDFAQCPD